MLLEMKSNKAQCECDPDEGWRIRAGADWGERSTGSVQQVWSRIRDEYIIEFKLIFQTVNKPQQVATRDVAYGRQQQHMLNKL